MKDLLFSIATFVFWLLFTTVVVIVTLRTVTMVVGGISVEGVFEAKCKSINGVVIHLDGAVKCVNKDIFMDIDK